MRKLEEQAAAFSVPNEFGATLSQAGAVGLNATTSHDATRYFMAMPANKLELWFALEAERFRVSLLRPSTTKAARGETSTLPEFVLTGLWRECSCVSITCRT